jgi:hypothetical protein
MSGEGGGSKGEKIGRWGEDFGPSAGSCCGVVMCLAVRSFEDRFLTCRGVLGEVVGCLCRFLRLGKGIVGLPAFAYI